MAVVICLVITVVVAVLWVNGIDKMNKEHPDYKGDDFLDY